jgi:predicted ATPase
VREDEARPLMTALQDHLGTKSVLLLLDEAEHLLPACAQLADVLLHACPHLKILVSSREALGMAGEVSFRVPSLSLPDAQHLPSLETLTQYDSVRLFIERAVAVKADFVVTNDNAPAVAQVCSRLDGIPLAIELAAARVKGLSVGQISQRLDDRFRLLTGGSRTALPRHQTLRAMIEWSYDLLSDSERALFRRLGVFVGEWTLEAAEAVCAGGDPSAQMGGAIGESDVLDLLLRLVDKSLVVPEERGGQTRYRMLETIHAFAREKLSDSGEEAPLRARHLEFFLKFSEQAEPKLHGGEQLIWLNQLGTEYENLGAALEWARDTGSTQPAPRTAKATEQLADVQALLGVGTKAIPLYQEALELLRSVEGADRMIAARLHGKIVTTVAFLKWRVEPDRFATLAQVATVSSAALVKALDAAGAEPPSLEKARLLVALSMDAQQVRNPVDWDAAERYARSAVEMTEKFEAPIDLSTALGTLADVCFFRGLWRERAQVALRRLAMSRESGFSDMQQRVSALIDTGEALVNVGEYAHGLPYLLEGESLAGKMQAVDLEKYALDERTHSLLRLDRWDETLGLDAKLRDMQQRYPSERIGPSCYAIAAIASIHAMRGELDLARSERQEAQAIMTALAGPSEDWGIKSHY